jgi:tRNA A37 threonylcarbamoyladenosine dehydratase
MEESFFMKESFERSAMLLGIDRVESLADKRVAIFGVGGVGGYVAEALARTGIGAFDLIDRDTVSVTNINRQIIATMDTVGKNKAEVMKERILSIHPEAEVRVHDCFFLPENADEFDFGAYDYVVDAVDTVTAKLEIIERAKKAGVPVISAMGAGNKLDPTKFVVTDISKTSVCPLAKVMRRELKKRNISDVKVVYSTEEALTPLFEPPAEGETRKKAPGSVAFVPSVAGLIVAAEVIKDLIR